MSYLKEVKKIHKICNERGIKFEYSFNVEMIEECYRIHATINTDLSSLTTSRYTIHDDDLNITIKEAFNSLIEDLNPNLITNPELLIKKIAVENVFDFNDELEWQTLFNNIKTVEGFKIVINSLIKDDNYADKILALTDYHLEYQKSLL